MGQDISRPLSAIMGSVYCGARHQQTTISNNGVSILCDKTSADHSPQLRLWTGHCCLWTHLKPTGIMDSAVYSCKETEQRVHHILQDCSLWQQQRPVTAAGWDTHQQAVGNGGRPALHHPVSVTGWDSKFDVLLESLCGLVLLVACLTSQQHVSVSEERICSDNFTCCHSEIEATDQSFYLTQAEYTDTGPTSPSADPIMPGAWQGSHWSANFWVSGMTQLRKILLQAGFEPWIFYSRGWCDNHLANERVSHCGSMSDHAVGLSPEVGCAQWRVVVAWLVA